MLAATDRAASRRRLVLLRDVIMALGAAAVAETPAARGASGALVQLVEELNVGRSQFGADTLGGCSVAGCREARAWDIVTLDEDPVVDIAVGRRKQGSLRSGTPLDNPAAVERLVSGILLHCFGMDLCSPRLRQRSEREGGLPRRLNVHVGITKWHGRVFRGLFRDERHLLVKVDYVSWAPGTPKGVQRQRRVRKEYCAWRPACNDDSGAATVGSSLLLARR